MSVEVKSTVFSFVTQRPPQLATQGHIKYNIIHPDLTSESNHFSELFSHPSENPSEQRLHAIHLANSFATSAYTNIPNLQDAIDEKLYHFANWLSINKEKVNAGNEEVIHEGSLIGASAMSDPLSFEVWNNLFYQVITDKSAYLREQLLHILVANQYCRTEGQSNKNQVATADVIIPAQLFGFDMDSLVNGINTTPIDNSSDNTLYKQTKVIIANRHIDESSTLIDELKAWKIKYNKNNTDRYNNARSDFELELKSNFEDNKVLVEAKEVTTQTITEFGLMTNTTTVPAHYTLPIDVVIPVFHFESAPEISIGILEEELTPESFAVARRTGITACNKIDEAINILNDNINNHTATIFQNTNNSQSVGLARGTVIPSAPNGVASNLYNYACIFERVYDNLNKKYTRDYTMVISICNTGITNPIITELNCTLDITGANTATINTTTSWHVTSSNANGSTVIYLFDKTGDFLNLFNCFVTARGSILFSNGLKLDFGPTKIISLSDYNSVITDGAYMTVDKEGEVQSEKPSGYGIRRLGIADYRKVEQTLCCYIPGEVSNIENVMAGEYRERSTRRLRRSEDTTVTEKQTEQENLTDNTVAERFQMQQQSNLVHSENMAASAGVTANYSAGPWNITAFGNIASNTSSSQSNSQAVSYGKDVTQRAMQRVVTKTREERTLKIIEEYEEQNKHGFDNRGGLQHVSGVYRWIDAKYKNQVINYGKRLMYEFMIPEPSRFHNLAMDEIKSSLGLIILNKPVDPRNDITYPLTDFTNLTEANAAYWAGRFNADIEACPDESLYIGKTFSATKIGGMEDLSDKDDLAIKDGYITEKVNVTYFAETDNDGGQQHSLAIIVGDYKMAINNGGNSSSQESDSKKTPVYIDINPYIGKIPVSFASLNYLTVSVGISIKVTRTSKLYKEWQIKTFNTIIAAYERKVDEYNAYIQQAASDNANSGNATNPLFFRQLENLVLQKNCIHYLLDSSSITLGADYYKTNDHSHKPTIENIVPDNTAEFDKYTAYASFLEQAFEWNIMSYEFLPFFWGNKSNWKTMYRNDIDDPLFHSFLQAGMARVVVSVRQGFEKAVMYFMATGKPWDGGTVPVIDDPLFLSIVEDLKLQDSVVEETWETTVPTTLTGLQKGTIAIEKEGLPCDCGDENDISFKDNVILSGIKVTG